MAIRMYIYIYIYTRGDAIINIYNRVETPCPTYQSCAHLGAQGILFKLHAGLSTHQAQSEEMQHGAVDFGRAKGRDALT